MRCKAVDFPITRKTDDRHHWMNEITTRLARPTYLVSAARTFNILSWRLGLGPFWSRTAVNGRRTVAPCQSLILFHTNTVCGIRNVIMSARDLVLLFRSQQKAWFLAASSSRCEEWRLVLPITYSLCIRPHLKKFSLRRHITRRSSHLKN